MSPPSGIDPPTAQSIASHVKRNAAKVKRVQKPSHHEGMAMSTREAEYDGHHIVVRTMYEIEIDGKPVTGHVGVTNDGQVHYHPIPNQSFPSMIDLVERLIDTFPDDFSDAAAPVPTPPHDHDHAAARSRKARKRAVKRKAR